LILAGIDTTWSAIGSPRWHLGSNPSDLARLNGTSFDDPVWLTMSEEVLRFYAPVTMGRRVVGDSVVEGRPVHKGDQLLVTFSAANDDPKAFERADEFLIDREVSWHVAFGLGIHRCLGSNLARPEMKAAFQEWCAAFPNHRINPDEETTWTNGQIRGPRKIPVILR
jgi:cytochrome P450